MNVTMTKNGLLIIKAENPVEGYALTKWCEENTIGGGIGSNILIKCEPTKGEECKD